MPSLKKSVLAVSRAPLGPNFEVESAANFTEALQAVEGHNYPVVLVDDEALTPDQLSSLFTRLTEVSPSTQRILLTTRLSGDELLSLLRDHSLFRLLLKEQNPNVENVLREADEEYARIRQNEELVRLTIEQNRKLELLSQDLDARVKKRQKYLETASSRLAETTLRLGALHRALVAVQQSSTIGDMEAQLTQALKGALQLQWIRIVFKSQSPLEEPDLPAKKAFSVFAAPLRRNIESVGQVFFARDKALPFTEDEIGFLVQVTEAVSLSSDRLVRLEQAESLKQQWEATFDAIVDPVALIDKNYDLVLTNQSFAKRAGLPVENLRGQKCYQALFRRNSPCANCQRGQAFNLFPHLTVSSQTVEISGQKIFVHMYQDLSSKQRLERKILESAKMAELGLIGGSIAHELNNPIAGIISFLQLIKMGLKGNEPYAEDIREMEQGAQRCKEIIQNLLVFTRKPETEKQEPLNLVDVLKQALKITELISRSRGIEILLSVPTEEVVIVGAANPLTQAFVNVFRHSLDRFIEVDRPQMKNPRLEVSLVQDAKAEEVLVNIDDSGPTSSAESPALSVARQIFNEHRGDLENSSRPDDKNRIQIRFPRPVFRS